MVAHTFSPNDNSHHKVIKRIATYLIAIGGHKSTVALAQACRAFEIPALQTLWELKYWSPGELSSRKLTRLSRYTPWIHRLVVGKQDLLDLTNTQLLGPVEPESVTVLSLRLQELRWSFGRNNMSFFCKFLSKNLTKITIFVHSMELWDNEMEWVRLAIKKLPTSLQSLRFQSSSPTYFTEEVSAYILQCGESLKKLDTDVVLSTQAIVHLMKLPNLHSWTTKQGSPQVADLIKHGVPDGPTSLFPSLELLELRYDLALEWLPLFNSLKSQTPLWIVAGGSLPMLIYDDYAGFVTSALLSRFLPLTNLTYLSLDMICRCTHPCASQFTDQDVENLAIALPKLQNLYLSGNPCFDFTCLTTVHSLLSLSIHCRELRSLCIHFLTGNLREDMLKLLNYAYSQDLHLEPKCALEELETGEMYFDDEDGLSLIAVGMLMIFPKLTKFNSDWKYWDDLEVMMEEFRQSGESLAVKTETIMECFNSLKNLVDCVGN